jgi:uncharacterized protein YggL (DUF469 family)
LKKRLRKKLHLKEFQHDGFAVWIRLKLAEDDESRAPFWKKLEAAIETRGLYVLGRADDFFVFTNYNLIPRPAIREADRYWMRDWLAQQPEVVSYRVRVSANTWYPVTWHSEYAEWLEALK